MIDYNPREGALDLGGDHLTSIWFPARTRSAPRRRATRCVQLHPPPRSGIRPDRDNDAPPPGSRQQHDTDTRAHGSNGGYPRQAPRRPVSDAASNGPDLSGNGRRHAAARMHQIPARRSRNSQQHQPPDHPHVGTDGRDLKFSSPTVGLRSSPCFLR